MSGPGTMRKPVRPSKARLLAAVCLVVTGCFSDEGPRPGTVLVIENRSGSAVQVHWPDVTGSENPDPLGPCRRDAQGLEPGRHTIELTSSSDHETLVVDVPNPSGQVPERWIVIEVDGSIDVDAPAGSNAADVC